MPTQQVDDRLLREENAALRRVLTGAVRPMARAIRFIKHLIRLRSFSLALWVLEYETHKPRYE